MVCLIDDPHHVVHGLVHDHAAVIGVHENDVHGDSNGVIGRIGIESTELVVAVQGIADLDNTGIIGNIIIDHVPDTDADDFLILIEEKQQGDALHVIAVPFYGELLTVVVALNAVVFILDTVSVHILHEQLGHSVYTGRAEGRNGHAADHHEDQQYSDQFFHTHNTSKVITQKSI